jgi:hypothetical protein
MFLYFRRRRFRETSLEYFRIESEDVGMVCKSEVSQLPLIGEESIVHLPKTALLGRAFRGLGCRNCPWMNPRQWQMPEGEEYATAPNELALNPWKRRSRECATIGTLEIRELD